MHTKKASRVQWGNVRAELEAQPERSSARIPRRRISHPRDAGARTTFTFPVGQAADYAIDGASGPPLVVREFPDTFEAAIDGVRAAATLADAIHQQPGAAMYLGAALLGGAIGSSVTQKREGALLGVGLGLLFAAMLEEERSRRP